MPLPINRTGYHFITTESNGHDGVLLYLNNIKEQLIELGAVKVEREGYRLTFYGFHYSIDLLTGLVLLQKVR